VRRVKLTKEERWVVRLGRDVLEERARLLARPLNRASIEPDLIPKRAVTAGLRRLAKNLPLMVQLTRPVKARRAPPGR
jgi:hypothetical protein